MNKIIGWRIDRLVDFEYVARWEVRFNRIATQIVESYAQEKCREEAVEFVTWYMNSDTLVGKTYSEWYDQWKQSK